MAQDEKLRAIRALLRDRPADARRRATAAIASARRARDARTAAFARFLRGDACQILGAMREAERDYRGARRWFERNGHARIARLVDLSDVQVQAVLGHADRFRAAVTRLRRALREPAERAVVEQAAGNGWRALGREDEAERCFDAALERLGRGRDRRTRLLRSLVRQDLGIALVYRGAAARGVKLLEQAGATLAALGLGHAASVAAANLAWARGIGGDFGAAVGELPEAARALRRQGDRRRFLLARLDAADARRRLGDFVRAGRESAVVAASLQRAGLPAEAARAFLTAARSRAALGRRADAHRAGRRAVALFERAGDRAGALEARLVAGEAVRDAPRALARAGRWTSAIDAAIETARAASPAAGARTLERAEAAMPPLFRPWLRPDRYRLRADAEPQRRIFWLRRAVRAAERLRARAPTAALRATSLARHLEFYTTLAAALLERGRAADRREAFTVLDAMRARTLREELDRLAPGIGQTRRVRALRRRLEELWRSLDQRGREPDGLRGSAKPILRDIRRLERALTEAWADTAAPAARRAGPVDAGACLTFAIVGTRCIGLFASDGEVSSWDAGAAAARARDMEAFRFQVRRRLHGATDTRAIDSVLARLAAALLPARFLAPERLRVVLPAELGDLPIEALPHDGTPLLESCTISYAPCAAWRARTWVADGNTTLIGLSAPGLPEIDREIGEVARITGGRVLHGAEATREAILGALRNSSLVHLAGHAEPRDDAPPLSALHAPDGWITAADLAETRLDGALVVLSACRTGDPALQWHGETLGGFPRALMAAGASGVVASRWPVDDRLARAWMEAMYRAVFECGPPESVRAAARSIRVRHSHPADWASFLFVPGGRG